MAVEGKPTIETPPSPTHPNGKVKINSPTPAYHDVFPVFSFRNCQPEHRHYKVKETCKKEDMHLLLKHLRMISELPWKRIEGNRNMFHMHTVPNHEGLSVPEGFELFQIKAFKHARIIGHFNKDNVFEIVLLDRNHEYCGSDR